MDDLLELLRELLVGSGLSQYELARRSGVSQPTVGECMRGGRVKFTTLSALFGVFGVEVRMQDGPTPETWSVTLSFPRSVAGPLPERMKRAERQKLATLK